MQRQRVQAGGGHLELMVVVAIAGVLLAVFLGRVSEVQALAQNAEAVTASSHARALGALIEARLPLLRRAATKAPPPASAQAPPKAAAP